MALIGPGLAIVPIGMSCQVAHQLRTHQVATCEAAGQHLELHTTPWDWIICGPAGVAQMLEDGATFPRAVADLENRFRPYWPARQAYFWHVKGAITHHADALREAQGREAWLDRVRAAGRRVFILANTQNNLVGIAREHGGFSVGLARLEVDRLAAAVASRFGPSALHVVSQAGRHDMDRARVHEFIPDGSEWQGDLRQWGRLLVRLAKKEGPGDMPRGL